MSLSQIEKQLAHNKVCGHVFAHAHTLRASASARWRLTRTVVAATAQALQTGQVRDTFGAPKASASKATKAQHYTQVRALACPARRHLCCPSPSRRHQHCSVPGAFA